MPSVAFYISGHGFGHTIRQIEVINALAALDPTRPIVIRTTAPRWLFERYAKARYVLIEGDVDTGVVQRDSLTLDEAETIRRAGAFYAELDDRADREAALIRDHGARLVVTDAPPLACAAAARAGVPSAVCANFTWDWIYEGYAEHLGLAPGLLATIRDAYALATAGWRMPMHGGFETVRSIVDLPFVARQPRVDVTRESVRRALGLPLTKPLALVSFGGYGVAGLPLDRVDCTPDWGIVDVAARSAPPQPREPANPDLFAIAESVIYSNGLRYDDIVRAVDVVITKPGYGIISDCVAAGTAMLYTSRGRFAEYDVLVAEMPRYLRCRYIDGTDFKEGRWLEALNALKAAPPPPENARVDGARVAAELIAARVATAT